MRKVLGYAKILGMSNRTATYLLIESKLGRSLSRYVTAARKAKKSWNAIALALHAETGVAVTSETLRIWFTTDPGMAEDEATKTAGVA